MDKSVVLVITVPPTALVYQIGVPELTICKFETVALAEAKKDCAFAIGAGGAAG